jgi:WD40 repeat protein
MNLEDIFLAAVDKHSPEDRAAFLASVCGEDDQLRARVEGLIEAHEKAGSILEQPLFQAQATIDEPISEGPGTVIGRYKLLEPIGEGGFGVVFMAEQSEPVKRKVALKILKAGMDSKQVIARFEAERQALAVMDHPNIAHVHDGGATDSGRPYFVMELVKGMPITQYCDHKKLPTRQRLELFCQVCQAVQHAHHKGIIHRDLKPSNVIVSSHDGRPVVKVIDFGIAKALSGQLTDKTVFTGFAQMIGTPLYMSPEQAGMSDLDVDTRSDIYSLGVLLYELLTGTTPFDEETLKKAGFDEMRRIIREEEPPRPSVRISTMGQLATTASEHRNSDPGKLSQSLRGELDWIVMKALEKDRNRRYETANGFAKDVQHYLADEPVQACPPSMWYRWRKFARRNKAAVTLAGVAATALIVIIAILVASNRVIRAEQKATARERDDKQEALSTSERLRLAHEATLRESATLALGQGLRFCERERVGQGTLWLARALKTVPPNAPELERTIRTSLRAWVNPLPGLTAVLTGEAKMPPFARFSPDGTVVLVQEDLRRLRLWSTATGQPIGQPLDHQCEHEVFQMTFAENADVILTVSQRKRISGDGEIHLWSARIGNPLRPPIPHPPEINNPEDCTAISPDGKTIAIATGSDVHLWDAAAGARRAGPLQLGKLVRLLTFSPDGERIVAGGDSGHGCEIRCWQVASGLPVGAPIAWAGRAPPSGLESLIGPYCKRVLGCPKEGDPQIYDLTTGKPLGQSIPATKQSRVRFSPDGSVLATRAETDSVGDVTKLHLWDTLTGKSLGVLANRDRIYNWSFRPDSHVIVTAGANTAQFWDVKTGRKQWKPMVHPDAVRGIAFNSTGTLLVTTCSDRTVRLWTGFGEPVGVPIEHKLSIKRAAFSRDGQHLMTSAGGGVLPSTLIRIWRLDPEPRRHVIDDGLVLDLSADGTTALTGASYAGVFDSSEHEVRMWNVQIGKPVGKPLLRAKWIEWGAFSHDGKWVAVIGVHEDRRTRKLYVWDRETRKLLRPPLEMQTVSMPLPVLAQNGQTLAVTSSEGTLSLDFATGRRRATIPPFNAYCFALSPDGNTLVRGGMFHDAEIWTLPTGKKRAVLPHRVVGACFSPDGRILATGCLDKKIRLWDSRTLKPVGRTLEQLLSRGIPEGLAFSPDGKCLAAFSGRSVRFWELASGRPLGPPRSNVPSVSGRRSKRALVFTRDGRSLVTAHGNVIRTWPVPKPVVGKPARIETWVQVSTGMELDAHGVLRPLDDRSFAQRRRELEQMGGAPSSK